jgi:hypothetical protein
VHAIDGSGALMQGYERGGVLRVAGSGVVARVSAVECHVASPPSPPPAPPPAPRPPPPDPPLLWWGHDAADDVALDEHGADDKRADGAESLAGAHPSGTAAQIQHWCVCSSQRGGPNT